MRSPIIVEAEKHLGVRWVHQGRNQLGLDCAGLIVVVGNGLNLINYQTETYARRTAGLEFLNHFKQAGLTGVRPADVKSGDVLVFRDGIFPCHCGLYSNEDNVEYLIHAYARAKKVVKDEYTRDWQQRLTYIFRFPDGISS